MLQSGTGNVVPIDSSKELEDFQMEVKKMEFNRAFFLPHITRVHNVLQQMKEARQCMITRIVDPYDFYIKFTDVQSTEIALADMQKYYNKPESLVELKFEPLFDVKIYLWRNATGDGSGDGGSQGDGRWERVRVIARNNVAKVCRIFLIDVGEVVTTYYGLLFELAHEFSRWEPQAIRVYLLDVKPSNGSADVWPIDAITAFKELGLKKTFTGIAIKKYIDKENSSFMEHCTRHGVVLSGAKYTLGADLCRMGFAKSIGLTSFRFDVIDDAVNIGEEIDYRNCDFNIEKLRIFLDNPCLTDEKPIEVKPTNFRGVLGADLDEDEKEVALPDSIKQRIGKCVMTYFISASCFYIRMHDKVPLYNIMVNSMVDMIDKIELNSKESVDVGTFVIVPILDDPIQRFHRAFVKGQLPGIAGVFQVFLIDLGRPYTVKATLMRELPECLAKIPPFCYRVHMDIVDCKGIPKWTNGANELSRRYFHTAASDERTCYFWRRSEASICNLDELGQELEFNSAINRWVPTSLLTEKQGGDSPLMLRALYKSVGIEIALDADKKSIDYRQSFKIDKLGDFLKIAGY